MSRMLLLLVPFTLAGAPPVLSQLEPWGAQRGKTVTLTLVGQGLMEGAKIVSPLPVTFTPLAPPAGLQGKRLPFLMEWKSEAQTGLYPVRIETSAGLSNILLFSVGTLPEINESEAGETTNDSIATAEAIKATPVLINGTLKPADRDTYKIHAKAGERRVIEVEARRVGSAIDPALRILDGSGKLMARVEDTPGLGVDCRADVTFPREGDYFIEVHDSRFSDQTVNFYRLKIGSYAYAEAMFPLGWREGQAVEVELSGGNLAATLKAAAEGRWVRIPASPASMPMPFVRGELPEMLEPAGAGPHRLALDTVMNGRIAKPGERDRYELAVTPGKDYLIELAARGLGTSRLDGVITIYDAGGKRLDSAGDQPPKQSVFATIAAGDVASDPYIQFHAPAGTTGIAIVVEDIAGAGGPAYGYRLSARERPPDFDLSLSTPFLNVPAGGTAAAVVNIERRGFGGPIQLKVGNLPEGMEFSGGTIPQETILADGRGVSRRGVVTISAKPGLAARRLELEVWGEAKLPDGSVIRRRAQGPGLITPIRGTLGFVDPNRRNQNKAFVAPWLGLELPAMVSSEAPGALEVAGPRKVRIIQGMKHEFAWTFTSKNMGVRAPMTAAADTPGALDLRVTDRASGERKAGAGALTMNTTIGTPASTFDVILSARVEDETIFAPAVTVEVVQGYAVDEPRQSAPLVPGGKIELAGAVRREEGFDAPVTISPDALPLGVTCQPFEASGSEYRISCEAASDAAPGDHKILLNPASILPEGEKGKVPYKIAAVEATLKVTK